MSVRGGCIHTSQSQTLALGNFSIEIHHFQHFYKQKLKSISLINWSKINQKTIFLPFSESSCPALYAGPIHFLHLLLKKYKTTIFYEILPNFIVKNLKKPKTWKISQRQCLILACMYVWFFIRGIINLSYWGGTFIGEKSSKTGIGPEVYYWGLRVTRYWILFYLRGFWG